jgi:hypothetical protein
MTVGIASTRPVQTTLPPLTGTAGVVAKCAIGDGRTNIVAHRNADNEKSKSIIE